MVLVSHDRELVANVCDELHLVSDGKVEAFDGDLADYSKWLRDKRKGSADDSNSGNTAKTGESTTKRPSADAPNTEEKPALSKEAIRKQKAEQRKLTALIRRQIEKAEAKLEALDAQLAEFEQKLSDTELYNDDRTAELMGILDAQKDCQIEHAEQENILMDAMEQLEEMEN